ncbi:MAG: hypothetical protein Ct9H300mP1_39660 [Planctomycetaceae bacterium]|nr:MAG: hypothetical protein Ct9H300mP1_39660 [Planctomycetaceae bacterium]
MVLLFNDELERQVADRRSILPTLEASLSQSQAQADVELSLKLRDLDREEFEVRTLAANHLEKQYYNEFLQTAWEEMLELNDGPGQQRRPGPDLPPRRPAPVADQRRCENENRDAAAGGPQRGLGQRRPGQAVSERKPPRSWPCGAACPRRSAGPTVSMSPPTSWPTPVPLSKHSKNAGRG